jgi:hypothetical protein
VTPDERRGLLALAKALGPEMSVPVPAPWLVTILDHSGADPAPAIPALPDELTQKEAATLLRVSVAYLRSSSCPKHHLPGNGPRGKPLVRYRRTEVLAWSLSRPLASTIQRVS